MLFRVIAVFSLQASILGRQRKGSPERTEPAAAPAGEGDPGATPEQHPRPTLPRVLRALSATREGDTAPQPPGSRRDDHKDRGEPLHGRPPGPACVSVISWVPLSVSSNFMWAIINPSLVSNQKAPLEHTWDYKTCLIGRNQSCGETVHFPPGSPRHAGREDARTAGPPARPPISPGVPYRALTRLAGPAHRTAPGSSSP